MGKVVISNPPAALNGGDNGTIFVTGGTGGLGCYVAAWLVTQKVQNCPLDLISASLFPVNIKMLDLYTCA